MIRVLHFADVINRHDFIDVIVRRANASEFLVGACVRTIQSNIADHGYPGSGVPFWNLRAPSRKSIPLCAWRLAGILRRWEPDVLHTHHYEQAVIGWIATRICRRTRLVIGRHYSDALYRVSGRARRTMLLQIEAIVNHSAARIIVPSQTIREILTKRQGVPDDKIDVVPYAFDPSKYAIPPPALLRRIREELGLGNRFVVGTFARLAPEKGHSLLLQSAAALREQIPGILFLFLGDGPERLAIEKKIRQGGLEDVVRLAGHRRDAMNVMAAVDIVAQPTLHEAFSQVMAEALWMRKPLIITKVSGAEDILRDGENALLVPKADWKRLAAAIERLAANPEERRRIASNGRAYAERNLAHERIIPLYEHCYREAVKTARARHRTYTGPPVH
jgi:glycosyltransferase involved in cell wall biosynthesis